MKMVKSLLLGSAAGLVAVVGAQAADLAPKPAPAVAVEYVKVCDAFGAGFYFVPGTDTCLRVGGYVRVDAYVANTGGSSPLLAGTVIQGNYNYTRDDNLTAMRARAVLDLDARTRTEYGTLRSFSRIGATFTTGQGGAAGSSAVYFERAFIQFAGFTAGYTQSFFDAFTPFAYNTLQVGSNRWNTVLAYTAQLGSGFSLTVAVEDGTNRRARIDDLGFRAGNFFGAFPTGTGIPNQNYAGHAMPDIVANLRVDQSWGFLQIMGAVHEVRPLREFLGTEYGYAFGAGLSINLPMIAAGDQFQIQGTYASGAIEYLGVSGSVTGASPAVAADMLGGPGGNRATLPILDAVVTRDLVGAANGLDLTTGYTVMAQFRHFWTPSLRTAIFGGITSVDYGRSGALNFADGRWEPLGGDVVQVGINTIWSPVRNLDIGVEVLYSRTSADFRWFDDPNNDGIGVFRTRTLETDQWAGMARIQRNF